MRITIAQGAFLPVPPLRGGAVEKVWFALGQEFARRGHEVTHLSRAFPGLPARETIEGVQHRRIGGFDTPSSLALLKAEDLLYSLHLLPHLPPADIVVTHTFWLPMLIRTPRLGKLYVHVARYPRGQMRFYRHAARLQTISKPIAAALAAEVPRQADRVRCIPLPLPESSHVEDAAPPPPSSAPARFLYAGRVHPEKGLHLLLRALALLPSDAFPGWTLTVVGPSETSAGGGGARYLAELQALAAPIRDRVEWAGPIFEPARLAERYRAASLFFYPSLAERGETFGLAPLEAMSHGCPALVSALACFRDFVVEDENGFVFDHRAADPAAALAARLVALSRDPSALARAGVAARAQSRAFLPGPIAELYLQDFASLLEENP